MQNDLSKMVTSKIKLQDAESGASLLCLFEIPDSGDARLSSCLRKCVANVEKYCRDRILPHCSDNGIYVYKLKISAECREKKIILSVKATLSDRRACKVILSECKTYKYKI